MTELGNKLTRASGGPLTPLALPQRCIPLLSPSRPHWGHWIAKLLSIAKPSHLFLPPLHWITSRAFWLLGSVASNLVSITFHIPRVFWSKGISSTYHYQLVNSPMLSDFHSDGLSLHWLWDLCFFFTFIWHLIPYFKRCTNGYSCEMNIFLLQIINRFQNN